MRNIRVRLRTLAVDLRVFGSHPMVPRGRIDEEAFKLDWQQHVDAVGNMSSAGV